MTQKEWLEYRKEKAPNASDDPKAIEALTPNFKCPACLNFRLHNDEERKKYHNN